MERLLELSSSERDFFGLVARAVTANPFSAERAAIDREIEAAGPGGSQPSALEAVVHRRLEGLSAEGRADLRRYRPEEAETLRFALLFDLYYRLSGDFDRLIREQLASGDEPLPVPFAAEALDELAARGFSRAEALQHVAMFFQLRRAFHFLDRGLVGQSPCMRALRRDLWNNVFTRDIRLYADSLWSRMEDFSTLLLGETGTGKGTAAAAIGRSGFLSFDPARGRFVESFTRAFVSLNLSQHPEPLVESALFGHEKGAFTGAIARQQGVFSLCSPHGAIFLDEIGEVPAQIQIKLLEVLQERTFTPVGSRKPERFRGRVVAATNRGLEELRAGGAFRDDFFYRLCSDVIVVPPLRRRLSEAPGELEELVDSLLDRMLGERSPALAQRVCETIAADLGPSYDWPGNVRELEQCVRRILLKGSYEGDRRPRAALPERLATRVAEGSLAARDLLAAYCALLHERHGSYEEVARITKLDRRTARKYVEQARGEHPGSST